MRTIAALLAACSIAAASAQYIISPETGREELQLPPIPTELTEPADRAGYLAMHFWDSMDFSDTSHALDDIFMEQNFVNYLSILSIANGNARARALGLLMDRAAAEPAPLSKLLEVGEKYLYEPQSPFYDEPTFALMASIAIEDPRVDEGIKMRLEYLVQDCDLNAPGSICQDLAIECRSDGRLTTLRRLLSGITASAAIVAFYDPECESCAQEMRALADALSDNPAIALISIYPDGDEELWQSHPEKAYMGWTDCIAVDDPMETGKYNLRATPTLYLIAHDGSVIMKNASLQNIISYVESIQ